SWSEAQATWQLAASGLPWGIAGCNDTVSDRAETASSEVSVFSTGWFTWSVRADVQAMVSEPETNHGWLIRQTTAVAGQLSVYASEHGISHYRPRLRVVYTVPGEGPTPTATATSIPCLPTTTPTPDPRRTPISGSEVLHPEKRIGFVAFNLSAYDLSRLHAGFCKLEDRGPGSYYKSSLGLDFCTVLRVGPQFYQAPDPATYWTWLERTIIASPGNLWFIGNEPENPCRGERTAAQYAEIYHKMYYFIKEHDSCAQVGIGGVVLPSAIRIRWLEKVLNTYRQLYGEPMPVDVWNTHALLLSECPGSCQTGDPSVCWPDPPIEPPCGGAHVPREFWCEKGRYFSPADQARADLFEALIWDFRRWMATREEARNKPLIITELGVFPGVQGDTFPHEAINQFMAGIFDFMLNTSDPDVGYAPDGYRLVQRWTWYSVSDRGFNGFLFHQSGELTDFGLNMANYTARFLPTSPISIFFQRGWSGYTDNGDVTIGPNEAAPYAGTLWLAPDVPKKALLKFDLSLLPTNVQVLSATLSLHSETHQNLSSLTVNCYQIKRFWQVEQATWTRATAGTLWELPGCAGASDRELAPAATTVVTSNNVTYRWDLTSLAQQWIADPAGNHGILLEGVAAQPGSWEFVSSDRAEGASHAYYRLRPKLELLIALSGPSPADTATPTATATSTQTPTVTPTATATNSPTPTPTHTATPTGTPTVTPSVTPTNSPTPTPTATATNSPTPTATPTGTATRTLTPSLTPSATSTPTLLPPDLPGDVDGDCDVDIVDIMLVAARWGSEQGDASYDARYDLDGDGDIDIADIMFVASRWGNVCAGEGLHRSR
ncbi:MAG: DNRLRE domain-containing protein, partial [Chloroflexi bacterium]|nr:DNRLRE domain-containing protein [Chloroflexota bacterium]